MNDYKPNSHRFKEQQKAQSEGRKITKVAHGSVKARKKNELTKIADVFISEDVSNVKSYILNDIVVPTVKKAIIGAIDMVLNGGSGSYTGRGTTSKVSYRKFYDDQRDDHRTVEARSRSRFDFDDIKFETRGEAEAVLEEMYNVIDRYGFVTVGDMYDMADLSQPFTSNKYGWTNIRSAEVMRLRGGGYILKLPKALPID